MTTQTILDIPTWQMYLSYFWILLHLSLFLCFLGAFPERGKLWEIAETSTDFERGQTHLDWAWKRAQPPPENRGQNRYSYWILLIETVYWLPHDSFKSVTVSCKHFAYDFIRMVSPLSADKAGSEKCFVERCRVIWVF